MTNPTIAAAIAINNTAPAAKSFVRLIASLYSGETKSARASMDELTASAANTAPITIVTAIHSMRESPNTIPAISTQTAAKQWIQALCSFVINSLIPLKANLKLLALFRNVKPSFFIFIASLIEEGKYTKTRSHTDGFRRNNANYWNKREICRFYLYSSIIWFCPVLEELGK